MAEKRSPFPGMDPYLEEHWRDVHQRLCTYSCDALQPQLRPQLFARLEERLIVETDKYESRWISPDVKVVEHLPGWRDGMEKEGGVALEEPLIVRSGHEPAFEGFIQIIDPTTGGKLVTVIEFLSPSNKAQGAGKIAYRQKQDELLGAGVSLVEIDLLRDGDWVVGADRDRVPRSPYKVCVHRGWKRIEYEVYPIQLNQRLPAIRIPLREKDKDARLHLQALIEQTYINGAYEGIDYRREPLAPLEGDAVAWADALLRKAGVR